MKERNILSEEYFVKTETCWNWIRAIRKDGYGVSSLKGKNIPAHRLVYEMIVGPIPKGMVIDHLCRNRACVNPNHLEPVTDRENIMRGKGISVINSKKTHCKHGHLLTVENVYLKQGKWRHCLVCKRKVGLECGRRYRAKLKKLNLKINKLYG